MHATQYQISSSADSTRDAYQLPSPDACQKPMSYHAKGTLGDLSVFLNFLIRSIFPDC